MMRNLSTLTDLPQPNSLIEDQIDWSERQPRRRRSATDVGETVRGRKCERPPDHWNGQPLSLICGLSSRGFCALEKQTTEFQPRFVQLRFRRPGAAAEQLCDLLVLVALDIVQNKHGSIAVG